MSDEWNPSLDLESKQTIEQCYPSQSADLTSDSSPKNTTEGSTRF